MMAKAQKQTFRDVAEAYLAWAKINRTEKFWRRQERILREDVLPNIGDLSADQILPDIPASVLALPAGDKKGLAAHNTVLAAIGWRIKNR